MECVNGPMGRIMLANGKTIYAMGRACIQTRMALVMWENGSKTKNRDLYKRLFNYNLMI